MNSKTEHINKEIEKLDYLDALRGIAILGVLATHIFLNFEIYNTISKPIIDFGKFGVSLFFLVSAYTLYKSWEQRKEESHSTTKYFIRRFFRIAPAYFLIITLVALIGKSTVLGWSTETSISWQNFLAHTTFTNFLFKQYANSILGVEWTIAVEVVFYLILPLILMLISHNKNSLKMLVFLFIASFLISIILYYLLLTPHGRSYFYAPIFFPVIHFPTFILGILTYQITKIIDIRKYNSNIYFIFYIICLIFYIWLIRPYFIENIQYYGGIDYLVSSTVFAPLLLGLAVRQKDRLYSIFCNKITIFIGKISFSLYLVHYIIINITKNLPIISLNSYELAAIAIATSMISAYVLYTIIEKNGIKLGKYIISKF